MRNDGIRRCRHGFPVTTIQDRGWIVPQAPSECSVCIQEGWSGPAYRPGKPGEAPNPKIPPPVVMDTCRVTKGCIIVIEQGKPHSAPCLVDDDPGTEPDHGFYSLCFTATGKMHAIGSYSPNWSVALCGQKGTHWGISKEPGHINCKTCKKLSGLQ